MARINVEDDVESRPEFRKLVRLLDGDDDKALGMLIRFWRVAQKYWGEGRLVPVEEISAWGFEPIVEAKWAVVRDEGVYAKGAEERFAWYLQKCEAGKKGGRPKKDEPPVISANRDTNPENRGIGSANREVDSANRGMDSENPPSPSPSPVRKSNTARTGVRAVYSEGFEEVWEQYGKVGKKIDASKAFEELSLDEVEFEKLRDAIPIYLADCKKEQRRSQYFGTFLREDWRVWLEKKVHAPALKTLADLEQEEMFSV